MRIGILTFYKVPNYGAMLQAYALLKYLEHRGHQVNLSTIPLGIRSVFHFGDVSFLGIGLAFVISCGPMFGSP